MERGDHRGFNLIEVIFAASLLSLVILMMFNLYPSSLLTIRQAEHRLEATSLAQSLLEEKRAGRFDQLTPANMVDSTATPGDDGLVFTIHPEVFDVAGTNPDRLKGLRVTVTWFEQRDTDKTKPHTVIQELYVCDIKR